MKFNAKDPQTWITRDLFNSYCGAGSEKMLSFYDKAVVKKNAMPWSLNWLAILILPAWFGYRKQWPLFATLAVICAALPFIEGIFGLKLPAAGLAGGMLALGFMANGLLLMTANHNFIKLTKSGMDITQIESALKNRASSSISSAIVGTVAFCILQFASVYIADTLFRLPL